MYVQGVTEVEVKSTEEAYAMFWKGSVLRDETISHARLPWPYRSLTVILGYHNHLESCFLERFIEQSCFIPLNSRSEEAPCGRHSAEHAIKPQSQCVYPEACASTVGSERRKYSLGMRNVFQELARSFFNIQRKNHAIETGLYFSVYHPFFLTICHWRVVLKLSSFVFSSLILTRHTILLIFVLSLPSWCMKYETEITE